MVYIWVHRLGLIYAVCVSDSPVWSTETFCLWPAVPCTISQTSSGGNRTQHRSSSYHQHTGLRTSTRSYTLRCTVHPNFLVCMYTMQECTLVTCSNSMSPNLLTVKFRLDPDCRLLLHRMRSCLRKWECILVNWSRQGNIACTVLGSNWISSSIPWRNTVSIICNVRMWCSSVWISSAKEHSHVIDTHTNTSSKSCYFFNRNLCNTFKWPWLLCFQTICVKSYLKSKELHS